MEPRPDEYAKLLLGIGKSVLFVGAPGTGKTRLAVQISRAFTGAYPIVVVGRGDMSYYDLFDVRNDIGAITLSILSSWIRLRAGCPPRWLLFDEINRANIELTLGELFTALEPEYRMSIYVVKPSVIEKIKSSDRLISILLDYSRVGCKVDDNDVRAVLKAFEDKGAPVPPSWRMMATMNIVDRAHLFRLGLALARRLPMIYVPGLQQVTNSSDIAETRSSPNAYGVNPPKDLIVSVCREAIDELLILHSIDIKGVTVKDYVIPVASSIDENTLVSLAATRRDVWGPLFELFKHAGRAGLELGYSIIADTCKLLALEEIMGEPNDKRALDIIVSSLFVPQLSTIVPQLKFELAMGLKTARQQALNIIRMIIEDVLGPRSLSALMMRAVELELAVHS